MAPLARPDRFGHLLDLPAPYSAAVCPGADPQEEAGQSADVVHRNGLRVPNAADISVGHYPSHPKLHAAAPAETHHPHLVDGSNL